MKGREIRKRLAAALSAAALILFAAASVRAEMLYTGVRIETGAGVERTAAVSYVPVAPTLAPTAGHANEQSFLEGLQRQWQIVREALVRSAVEAVITMFFIKAGPPPPTKPPGTATPIVPPPTGHGTPTPPPPPPPPPTGSGEPPPLIDPPVDPPPVGTPEPASLLIALIGGSWLSVNRWRQRGYTARAQD